MVHININRQKLHTHVTARVLTVILLVLLQAAILVIMFQLFRSKFAYYYVVCALLSLLVTLHIVRRDTVPEYKIAWIIPILLLPIFGGLFYLMFGRVRPSRKERRHIQRLAERGREALQAEPLASRARTAAAALAKEDNDAFLRSRYLHRTAMSPVFCGTRSDYFSLGEDMYLQLLEDLRQAEKFIFLEYFIIESSGMWNSILDILVSKAQQGLDVRVMYDDFGCMFQLPAEYPQLLESLGLKCAVFNRFSNIFSSRFNNRDHRKICVIDGNIGYTGGINLADRYINTEQVYGHWKDTAVRLEGDAVWNLSVMFLSLWNLERGTDESFLPFMPGYSCEDDGFVQPFTDVPLDEYPVGASAYTQMINRAQRYVYITTPYLVIDSEMISALTGAAQSGLDVRLITPGVPDKKLVYALTRSYYEVLLKNGVKIYEYTPGFIHAKSFVSDDHNAVIGTINLDYRSLYLHYECAVWLHDSRSVLKMRDDFLATQQLSREITPKDCRSRWLLKRIFVSLLRVFAPLF